MGLTCVVFAFGSRLLTFAHTMWVPISLWQLALIETYVLASDAWGGPWTAAKLAASTTHLAAVAVWLGGLLALAAVLLPGTGQSVLRHVLPRFSVLVLASVLILVGSGLLHAVAVAGSVRELVDSDYGTVLLIKLLVFGVLLALGTIGRRYAAAREGGQTFVVVIGAELALAAGVLTATAVLVQVAASI